MLCTRRASSERRVLRRGHKVTGLSNSLDGKEDWLIGREAADFWKALRMDEERLRAKKEVDELLASGAITSFGDWQKVVRHPESTGAQLLEGQEFEGELDVGEKPYLTLDDEALIAADEADFFRGREEAPEDATTEGAEASRLAVSTATRLAQLKALRAQHHAHCLVPAAAWLVDSEIKQVARGIHAGGREESKMANEKLSAYMDRLVDKEKEVLAKRRAAAARQRRIARKQAAYQRGVLRKKKQAAKAKAELKKKVDALPVSFRADVCGQPGHRGLIARQACLERLKLRAPPLPFELEVRWTSIRNDYCSAPLLRACYKLKKQATVGPMFINEVNGVLRLLCEHYAGPTEFNRKGQKGGDALAFEKFARRAQEAAAPPRAATVASM